MLRRRIIGDSAHLTLVGHHSRLRYSRRTPETVRFLRRAAPAFFRQVSKEYKRETLAAPNRPRPKEWPEQGLHAAWLGHSTVVLKLDGFTILTDPVFSGRIGLNLGPLTLGIKRLVDVAAPLFDLPPIDLILLSHAHMDHFDLPSLRQLESARTQVDYGRSHFRPAAAEALRASTRAPLEPDCACWTGKSNCFSGGSLGCSHAERYLSRI